MTDVRQNPGEARPKPRRDRTKQLQTLLPEAGAGRWRASQKAAVVIAVRTGLLGADEALARYAMAPEELRNWSEAFDRGGVSALRARDASH